LIREINDRIYEVLQGDGSEDADFLCECGYDACHGSVQLTLREYATLRADHGILRSKAAHEGATP
jgi:hypothetical protein